MHCHLLTVENNRFLQIINDHHIPRYGILLSDIYWFCASLSVSRWCAGR